MKKYLFGFALVLSGLIMSGCAKVPQAEVDGANAAIELARVAQADVYLSAEFAAVQDSMNAINAEIETQKSKMFASYGDVKLKLASVTASATELEGKTAVRKEAIKSEVNAAIAQLQTLAAENLALVESAPKGKEGKAAIEAIKGDLSVIDAAAAEIPALLESGDLLGAQSKANATLEKANAIKVELTTVVEKYNKKN